MGKFTQTVAGQKPDGLRILDSTTTPFSGRSNTTAGGSKWLDSNDSRTVSWTLNVLAGISKIGFFLSDVGDVGASMFATFTDGSSTGNIEIIAANSGTPNGQFTYVSLDFGGSFAGSITFEVSTASDGWGIDDVTTAAPVPLPAGALLLISGLFGMGAVRRFRKAA